MITVYTTIIGQWDQLRAPEVTEAGVRYICYSDIPRDPVAPWEIQPAYMPYANNSRNSRLPKILPHLHFDAVVSIYHDANFVLRGYPSHLIAEHLKSHDIAMFQHPCRKHVGEETAILLKEKIGDPCEVEAAQTLWKHHGAPLGLWAGGFIVRRHTPEIRELNEAWWQLFRDGCTRDQISLPVAVHQCGIKINTLRGNIYECNELAFHWHAAWAHKGDNPKYATRNAELQTKRMRLMQLAKYPEVRA